MLMTKLCQHKNRRNLDCNIITDFLSGKLTVMLFCVLNKLLELPRMSLDVSLFVICRFSSIFSLSASVQVLLRLLTDK